MMNGPQIGIAHLTALSFSPPQLVRLAATAGYASVGVRVHPATATETRYPMLAPSAMLTETAAAMAETGVSVLDIEVLAMGPEIRRDTWRPVLEAGAVLGAQVLNVVGSDPNEARFVDKLGTLVEDAKQCGILPSLEPISYQCVDTIPMAHRIAAATGAGIILDALHFVRSGGVLAELEALPSGMVTIVQLCDGPAAEPEATEFDGELPLGQPTGGSARQLESRAHRLLPGTGEFPLLEILALFPDAPISVEVPDVAAVNAHGMEPHLRAAFDATAGLLAAAAVAPRPRPGATGIASTRFTTPGRK
jgi:sugar phosphate isomerase/epimerase